jgi:hypothetical protein
MLGNQKGLYNLPSNVRLGKSTQTGLKQMDETEQPPIRGRMVMANESEKSDAISRLSQITDNITHLIQVPYITAVEKKRLNVAKTRVEGVYTSFVERQNRTNTIAEKREKLHLVRHLSADDIKKLLITEDTY